MFDSTTSELIRLAPEIGGINGNRLPELLTQCYSTIATVRLRLAHADPDTAAVLHSSITILRRLAATLEVHAALTSIEDERSAAAYVSATAHQLLFKAQILLPEYRKTGLVITRNSVSSELAAALLFLAAGYPSDAGEVMLGASVVPDARAPLVSALIEFSRGHLNLLGIPDINIPLEVSDSERAELILWQRILTALRDFAERFFLMDREEQTRRMDAFNSQLEQVRQLSIQPIDLPQGLEVQANAFSAFAGPYHLATLLMAAGRGMDQRALVSVPDPAGPPTENWHSYIRRRVDERPFLWTNHMDAVYQGLLNSGQSAVISFPTGAGKSTLSELKIAAAVLSGKKVVYLAPTLALVAQVTRELNRMLSEDLDEPVEGDLVDDGLFFDMGNTLQRAVTVMTPDRCLLLLTVAPDSFVELGLVVFDECHSLHMSGDEIGKRPVSAMLGLLRILEIAPDVDVLLMSAMMKNGGELANWLRDSFGKDAILFDAAWKPTRQARGSVVFDQRDVTTLKKLIPRGPARIPHAKLNARPCAFVGLQQTWASDDQNDYCVLPLIENKTPMQGKRYGQTGKDLKLKTTECASAIAESAAERGLKTIVFFHTPTSIQKALREMEGAGDLAMTDPERELFEAASAELGGDAYVLAPNQVAGGHHGDLLDEERELVETAFKRGDGIRVLFSTNTLAQGMNLPADLVIIVRTRAYKADAGTYSSVEVHDLLNAAGRAGRAGHSANGMVLVIPNLIVQFDANGEIGNRLADLQDAVLAHDDRCLEICDPIDVILDAIDSGRLMAKQVIDYLLYRLPPGGTIEDAHARGLRFFSKSLAARRAIERGLVDEFEAKVEGALARRTELMGEEFQPDVERLCSATGLSPGVVRAIQESLQNVEDIGQLTTFDWGTFSLRVIDAAPDAYQFFPILHALRGSEQSIDHLVESIRMWLTGQPLVDIEVSLDPQNPSAYLKAARRFARQGMRELSYAVGLIAQIASAEQDERHKLIALACMRAALQIRDGVDSMEKWALFRIKRSQHWTRVRVHRESTEWLRFVRAAPGPGEEPAQSFLRVSGGVRMFERQMT